MARIPFGRLLSFFEVVLDGLRVLVAMCCELTLLRWFLVLGCDGLPAAGREYLGGCLDA